MTFGRLYRWVTLTLAVGGTAVAVAFPDPQPWPWIGVSSIWICLIYVWRHPTDKDAA